MARKTLPVRKMIEAANRMLENSLDNFEQGRSGVCAMLEVILFDAGCYEGFSYLPSAGLKNGGTIDVSVDFEYRRRYTISSKLL